MSSSVLLVSPLHAAAVNGDKVTLQKLLGSFGNDLEARDRLHRTPLIYAVLGDRPECVDVLLKTGASVDSFDNSGRTALHWAAQKGHVQCSKLLLSHGANWKARDCQGMTTLHLATRHNSSRCLALLLKQLAPGEVDDQDTFKRTALHWSASLGHSHHIRLLMKQDANIGIPDIEGKTPLHWAASCKDPSAATCVKIILDNAPSVINWQDYEGRTALHLAVADGNNSVVQTLISSDKCNINPMDNMFRTPLHWAAVLGLADIVCLLLDGKADFASSDSNEATPLHYAAQNNFAETVEMFLSRSYVTDEPDNNGRNALLWAASKGANEVIRVMQRLKANLNSVDKNGATALHAAALSGHLSTVQLLLQFGVSVDLYDNMRHTPLFCACEMGHVEIVQILMEHQTDLNWMDVDGKLPLHWAAIGGHAYVCQILIKQDLNPNAKDLCGRTPLQCAAFGGYIECMSTLLENGSFPNIQDNEGMTALHWACSRGHLDAVKLLFDHGAYPNHMAYTDDSCTALDLALLGEHHEVVQYMIEHGGVSINRIQDIAATKIQAYYRGYRVRKGFGERKKLLVRHEQLKRDAAKKRAENETRVRDSIKNTNTEGTQELMSVDNPKPSSNSFCFSGSEDCLSNPSSSPKVTSEEESKIKQPEMIEYPPNNEEIHDVSSDPESTSENKTGNKKADNFQESSGKYLHTFLSESDESSADEDTFKHLDARGIKLNRKRFPTFQMRPHSSSELHRSESQHGILHKFMKFDYKKDMRPKTERIIRRKEDWEKVPSFTLDLLPANNVLSSFNKYNLNKSSEPDSSAATIYTENKKNLGDCIRSDSKLLNTDIFQRNPKGSDCEETCVASNKSVAQDRHEFCSESLNQNSHLTANLQQEMVEFKSPRLSILKSLRKKMVKQKETAETQQGKDLKGKLFVPPVSSECTHYNLKASDPVTESTKIENRMIKDKNINNSSSVIDVQVNNAYLSDPLKHLIVNTQTITSNSYNFASNSTPLQTKATGNRNSLELFNERNSLSHNNKIVLYKKLYANIKNCSNEEIVAAEVIQKAWKRYSHRKQNMQSDANCIFTNHQARKAAEDAWQQCLAALSLQKVSFSALSSTRLSNSLSNEGKVADVPLARKSAHYSYNLQNQQNLRH